MFYDNYSLSLDQDINFWCSQNLNLDILFDDNGVYHYCFGYQLTCLYVGVGAYLALAFDVLKKKAILAHQKTHFCYFSTLFNHTPFISSVILAYKPLK